MHTLLLLTVHHGRAWFGLKRLGLFFFPSVYIA